MRTRFFPLLVWLLLGSIAAAQSWHDDSRYVPLGPRSGYYIVRPGSHLSRQLGLEGAPISDGIFIRGKSTPAEVQSVFRRFRRVEQRRDGFIGYYQIEVYNPFEDQSGRGRR